MMRTPIIAGNWKMNMSPVEAIALVRELKPLMADAKCQVVVCPPYICLPAVAEEIKGSDIALGAQNIHWADKGAFTGEISAPMLRALGVQYAIVGHSERRQFFGETDETVRDRAKNALSHGITPIICVGESLEQRENGVTNAVVTVQTVAALKEFAPTDVEKVVIAYEPIWAIGTGKTATSAEANETIGVVRRAIADVYGKDTASKVRIQYGGSMNAQNASELMAMPEIDGGLIGGASLKAEDFSKVVHF